MLKSSRNHRRSRRMTICKNSSFDQIFPTKLLWWNARNSAEVSMENIQRSVRYSLWNCKIQKQPPKGVPRKSCSENMQQSYRRTPMTKCDFNKVAKRLWVAAFENWHNASIMYLIMHLIIMYLNVSGVSTVFKTANFH